MSVSFIGLFALAGLAAVVFLAALGLIALLTNPKTRDVAKILLGALAAMVILVGLVGVLFFGVSQRRVALQEEARREIATARLEALGQEFKNETHLEESIAPAQDAPLAAAEAAGDADAKPEAASTGSSLELPPNPRGRDTIDSSDEPTEVENLDEAVATKSEEAPSEETVEETVEKEEAAPAPEEPEKAASPVEAEESEVGELSVAPLDRDGRRPDWAEREPYKEGSVYCWPVVTDPRSDLDQAELEALPEALDEVVADYIAKKLRLGSVASRQVRLDPTYILDNLVGDDIWVENRSLKVGEFVRIHALVKFDRQANSVIRETWESQQVVGRLWSAGGFLAMVLFALAVVYCYLKLDQVTHGAKRGLLRFAAILVILGLMLVAAKVASMGIARKTGLAPTFPRTLCAARCLSRFSTPMMGMIQKSHPSEKGACHPATWVKKASCHHLARVMFFSHNESASENRTPGTS